MFVCSWIYSKNLYTYELVLILILIWEYYEILFLIFKELILVSLFYLSLKILDNYIAQIKMIKQKNFIKNEIEK